MYKDSLGIETIGYGHNLRDKPISQRAAQIIFEDDLSDARNDLNKALPWASQQLDPARYDVLLDMCYNMGIKTLLTFQHTLAMIQNKEYVTAANNLVNTPWAKEVGPRATELLDILRNGGN